MTISNGGAPAATPELLQYLRSAASFRAGATRLDERGFPSAGSVIARNAQIDHHVEYPQHGSMSLSVLPAIGSWVVALILPLQAAEENKTADVFRDHSPDKKFAMRIVCDAEFAEEKEIPNHAFHSASIVRLPGKEEAASLLSTDSLAGFS